MAILAGKSGLVKISTNTVAELKSWSLSTSMDMGDSTTLGDSWKESIALLGEWSASSEGNFDIHEDTNGQTALQTAFLAGSSVTLKLYINSTNYYSGTAYIKSMGVDTKVSDIVTVKFEFQGSGALSYS